MEVYEAAFPATYYNKRSLHRASAPRI